VGRVRFLPHIGASYPNFRKLRYAFPERRICGNTARSFPETSERRKPAYLHFFTSKELAFDLSCMGAFGKEQGTANMEFRLPRSLPAPKRALQSMFKENSLMGLLCLQQFKKGEGVFGLLGK
jgi:hypothetical protein